MDNTITIPANAPAEFTNKIKGVYEKAKANGDSLIGFGDFVNAYWTQYKAQNVDTSTADWDLKDINGVPYLFNKRTGQLKPYTATGGQTLEQIEGTVDSGKNTVAQPQVNIPEFQSGNNTLESISQGIGQTNQGVSYMDKNGKQISSPYVAQQLKEINDPNLQQNMDSRSKSWKDILFPATPSTDVSLTDTSKPELPVFPESYRKTGLYLTKPLDWKGDSLMWGTQDVPSWTNQQPLNLAGNNTNNLTNIR